MQHTVEIPLRARDGTIRAWAILDSADADLVRPFRWYLTTWGRVAAHVPGSGERGEKVLLHRLLMGLTAGDGLEVDHINRDPLDNRRCNLRLATRTMQAQNTGGYRRRRSRHRNVYRNAGKWAVRVMVAGKLTYLGRFTDEDEAGRVAAAFRARHMPFSPEASGEPTPHHS